MDNQSEGEKAELTKKQFPFMCSAMVSLIAWRPPRNSGMVHLLLKFRFLKQENSEGEVVFWVFLVQLLTLLRSMQKVQVQCTVNRNIY